MRTPEQTQHTQADDLTRYMLHLCYTCDDANRCTTEEAVRACMAAHAEIDQPEPAEGVEITQGFMNMMYA